MAPARIFDPIYVGDRVRMRRPHACGSDEWVVHRVGADIGLTCCQCRRRVMLSRRRFTHRLQAWLERGASATDARAARPASRR